MTGDSDEPPNTDLDAFQPSPPNRKLDDKAAKLELEIQALRSQFNKERVTYHFVIVLLFNLFVVVTVKENTPIYLSLIGTVILLYGTARWLDHPWLGDTLSRWHDLIFDVCKQRLLKKDEKVEPLPVQNENNA